ncbi:hypothetical protein LIPSTDRAFT_71282 [Lipomyces starkeyi NRRL Y-11557]|uniref:Uncharacterized protein n=1 Tax=Lipomyces starkeyi NRRL Y-11557 TaxID=675824 RepID=A0A1E3Q7P5_LIPST|nr:hypothetical protein LIPSTDRAFT_71282 [Lipomyces starkeyi NRRL Y-11557]
MKSLAGSGIILFLGGTLRYHGWAVMQHLGRRRRPDNPPRRTSLQSQITLAWPEQDDIGDSPMFSMSRTSRKGRSNLLPVYC